MILETRGIQKMVVVVVVGGRHERKRACEKGPWPHHRCLPVEREGILGTSSGAATLSRKRTLMDVGDGNDDGHNSSSKKHHLSSRTHSQQGGWLQRKPRPAQCQMKTEKLSSRF